MNPNVEMLKSAIESKSCMRGKYDGHERFFCPHLLGMKRGKAGDPDKVNVLVYQYAGNSSTGPILTPPVPTDGPSDNWKCMLVSKLSELAPVDGTWYTCQRHTQPSTCVDRVIAEVAR